MSTDIKICRGGFDFENIYRKAVERAPQQAVFVEVGSWLGKSTSFLAVEIINSGKEINMYCVDTWRGTTGDPVFDKWKSVNNATPLEKFTENMEGLMAHNGRQFVWPVVCDSAMAAARFADQSCDMVYIDADHSYEACRADIRAWMTKVKPEGVFAGHDVNQDGVRRAVEELFPNYRTEHTGDYPSWIASPLEW